MSVINCHVIKNH